MCSVVLSSSTPAYAASALLAAYADTAAGLVWKQAVHLKRCCAKHSQVEATCSCDRCSSMQMVRSHIDRDVVCRSSVNIE